MSTPSGSRSGRRRSSIGGLPLVDAADAADARSVASISSTVSGGKKKLKTKRRSSMSTIHRPIEPSSHRSIHRSIMTTEAQSSTPKSLRPKLSKLSSLVGGGGLKTKRRNSISTIHRSIDPLIHPSIHRSIHQSIDQSIMTTENGTSLEDLMNSPQSPRDRSAGRPAPSVARSSTPSGSRSGRRRSSIGGLPLVDAADAADTRSVASISSTVSGGKKKLKTKRSKSKDPKQKSRKLKVLHDGGYGSDGALDEAKKRARGKKSPSAAKTATTTTATTRRPTRSKSPKPGRSKSTPVDTASISPITGNHNNNNSSLKSTGLTKRFTSMFQANKNKNNNNNNNSNSSSKPTLDDSITSLNSWATGGEEKSLGSISGPRSVASGGRRRTKKKGEDGSNSAIMDWDAAMAKKDPHKNNGDAQTTTLHEKHENLQGLFEKEQQRSKRLRKKLAELKIELGNAPMIDGVGEITTQGTGDLFELEKKAHKRQLQEKDKKIAALQRLMDGGSNGGGGSGGGDMMDQLSHDSTSSVASVHSSGGGGGDAIWNRLQTLLNETREELSVKEELLKAQTANLALQTDRVDELKNELEERGMKSVKKWRDDYKLLQDQFRAVDQQLQTERKENEEKMQKKDEALVFFRNELFKLKQGESQRSVLGISSEHGAPASLDASTHSQSSRAARALGGISSLVSPVSLWAKEKVIVNGYTNRASSIAMPRLD